MNLLEDDTKITVRVPTATQLLAFRHSVALVHGYRNTQLVQPAAAYKDALAAKVAW